MMVKDNCSWGKSVDNTKEIIVKMHKNGRAANSDAITVQINKRGGGRGSKGSVGDTLSLETV